MVSEKRRKIAKALALFVTISGLMVIVGWIFDIGVLKSLSPGWISMKFDTAVAFVLSGITLFYIAQALEGQYDWAQVVLSLTSLIIILLMGTLFFSALLGIRTGAEQLFFVDDHPSAQTISPGRPSIPTMINFMLIAVAGMLILLKGETPFPRLKVIGWSIGVVGAFASLGYLFHVPLLYYFIADVNSAMAAHTAFLFVLLGAGLICLSE